MESRKVKERQPGRTLVVKFDEDFDVSSLKSLSNMKQMNEVKNNTLFLTFNDTASATSALTELNKMDGLSCRYSYYRVFFKLNGLTESSTYENVKKVHTAWVEEHTGGKVLEYNLYRKKDTFLNCGDLVVDLKTSLDLLLLEKLKNYELDGGLNGTYHKYRKKGRRTTHRHSNNQYYQQSYQQSNNV